MLDQRHGSALEDNSCASGARSTSRVGLGTRGDKPGGRGKRNGGNGGVHSGGSNPNREEATDGSYTNGDGLWHRPDGKGWAWY